MRVSCDSIVALGALTANGSTIFAKNSDRPADESQPLIQVAATDHALGERLHCQYIEIDQVSHTHAFLGSHPHWLWGLEHGVNEYRVAIGNHTIYTKDPVAETGLLGMDLVRLGLERGTTAEEAVSVIVDLIERHGQGGSGFRDTVWPYHNSFLVADPGRAFVVEASARQWAVREVDGGASVSNHVTIGSDWTRLSRSCIEHAREMGWWSDGTTRFDFAAAYRDISVVPPQVSSGRHRTTCRLLASGLRVDAPMVKRLMRDHYESGEVHRPGFEPDDERYFSVCMHAGGVGTTTASMVVELVRDGEAPQLCWIALGSPCMGPYLPVFVEAALPPELARGALDPTPDSAWWQIKALSDRVETDWERSAPLVREVWRAFEAEVEEETAGLLGSLSGGPASDDRRRLEEFMADVWRRATEHAQDLLARLS